MKNKIFSVLSVLLMFSFLMVNAQQQGAHIAFDKIIHNYGKIHEDGGKAVYKFEFTNTGSEPLVITSVNPTCGCTSSNYTKQPVKAGERGFVSAEFNPMHRPGPFNKTIRVVSNSVENPTVVLKIKGEVLPKKRTVADDYPRQMGSIRLNNTQFSFMNIKNTEIKTKEIKIINTGDKDVRLDIDDLPSYISVEIIPKNLRPGEKGVIKTTYNAIKSQQFGFLRYSMILKINGQFNSRNRLNITAIVKEDFSKLTDEQRANAPHITFKSTKFDFGSLTQGDKVEHVFKFTNTGKSNLLIRKVKSSCGCTAVAPPKMEIKPGESSEIKATFNSRGKLNRQHKTVTVYVNDPNHPEVRLEITGTVMKKSK